MGLLLYELNFWTLGNPVSIQVSWQEMKLAYAEIVSQRKKNGGKSLSCAPEKISGTDSSVVELQPAASHDVETPRPVTGASGPSVMGDNKPAAGSTSGV